MVEQSPPVMSIFLVIIPGIGQLKPPMLSPPRKLLVRIGQLKLPMLSPPRKLLVGYVTRNQKPGTKQEKRKWNKKLSL